MTADIDRNDVLAAMRGIDVFKAVPADAIKAERLGGLTNRNFRIDSPLGRHVLRIPGAGTSEYINRKNEARAARRQLVPLDQQHIFPAKLGQVIGRRAADDAAADDDDLRVARQAHDDIPYFVL